jgi:hypothetical protein
LRHQLTTEERAKGGKLSAKIRKAALRLERQLAQMGFAESVIHDLKDITVELIKTAQTNPLVGIAVSLVTVDILKRLHIIDEKIFDLLVLIISAAAGVDLARALLEGLIPGTGNVDLIKPVPSTYTRADTMQNHAGDQKAETSAILGMLSKVVK